MRSMAQRPFRREKFVEVCFRGRIICPSWHLNLQVAVMQERELGQRLERGYVRLRRFRTVRWWRRTI